MKLIAAIFIAASLWMGVADTASADPRRHSCDPWQVARHFGTYEGGEKFQPRYDLNHDGAVTVGDIIIASNCWLDQHSNWPGHARR